MKSTETPKMVKRIFLSIAVVCLIFAGYYLFIEIDYKKYGIFVHTMLLFITIYYMYEYSIDYKKGKPNNIKIYIIAMYILILLLYFIRLNKMKN